ncbi:helix-turn-helix domain-containing protein [Geodermatophilus sp. SYSU D00079]
MEALRGTARGQVRRHTSSGAAGSPVENVERQVIERLRAVRSARGLSQRAVAEAMVARGFDGWSQVTASNCEAGKRPLRLGELAGLADVYGVTVADLLTPGEDDRPAALAAVVEASARMAEAMEAVQAAEQRHARAEAELAAAARELTEATRRQSAAFQDAMRADRHLEQIRAARQEG